jgi:hypothetical protein
MTGGRRAAVEGEPQATAMVGVGSGGCRRLSVHPLRQEVGRASGWNRHPSWGWVRWDHSGRMSWPLGHDGALRAVHPISAAASRHRDLYNALCGEEMLWARRAPLLLVVRG